MTSRLEFTRTYPFLPYITMRCAFVAMEHFGADFITAALRPEYQSPYRRMYGAVSWSAPRPYPWMTRLQALMAYDCKGMWPTPASAIRSSNRRLRSGARFMGVHRTPRTILTLN